MPSPRPRVPPVTSTLRMGTRQLARRVYGERCHLSQRGWNLVGWQRAPALFQDFRPDGVKAAFRTGCTKNDVRDDDGAGYGTATSPDAGHPHRGVLVDDGFDFFRMDLLAADIDDALAAPDEVIAVATYFDHVARVHKAVRIGQRPPGTKVARSRPRRSDTK